MSNEADYQRVYGRYKALGLRLHHLGLRAELAGLLAAALMHAHRGVKSSAMLKLDELARGLK